MSLNNGHDDDDDDDDAPALLGVQGGSPDEIGGVGFVMQSDSLWTTFNARAKDAFVTFVRWLFFPIYCRVSNRKTILIIIIVIAMLMKNYSLFALLSLYFRTLLKLN